MGTHTYDLMPLPDDTKAITGMLKNIRDSARRFDARTLRVRTEPKQRSGANLQHKEKGGAVGQGDQTSSTFFDRDEPSTLDDTASPEIAPARWKNLDDATGSVAPADAFKGWFGASQVRDDEGRPQRLFHGTVADQDFDQFDRGHATVAHAGKGFYFAENPKIADTFAAGEGGRTLPTYLSIKKPFDFDGTVSKEEIERWKTALKDRQAQDLDHVLKGGSLRTDLMGRLADLIAGLFRSSPGNVSGLQAWKALGNVVGASQVNATLKDLGYDGIKHTAMGLHGGIRPPGSDAPDLGKVFVAFEPTQIKSATGNEGTYDPNDPRIHKERGGAITPPTPASQPSRIHRPSAEPVTPVASFTPWSTLKRGWKTGKAAAGSVSALLNVPGMDTGQVAAGVLSALVAMNQGAGSAAAMLGTHVYTKPITKDAALTAADAFGQMRRPEDEHPEPSQLRRPQIHREEGGPVLSRMPYLTTAQPDPSAKLQQIGGEVPEVPGLPRQADEVPIKAQAGEVMVKNGPAQVYRQQLDAMNNDQVPHFDRGGEVGQRPSQIRRPAPVLPMATEASGGPSQLRRPASNNEKAMLRMQREAEEQAAKFEDRGVPSEAAWYRRQAAVHAAEVERIRALLVAKVAAPEVNPSTVAPPSAEVAPSADGPPNVPPSSPAQTPESDNKLPAVSPKPEFDAQAWCDNRAHTAEAGIASWRGMSKAITSADAIRARLSGGKASPLSWAGQPELEQAVYGRASAPSQSSASSIDSLRRPLKQAGQIADFFSGPNILKDPDSPMGGGTGGGGGGDAENLMSALSGLLGAKGPGRPEREQRDHDDGGTMQDLVTVMRELIATIKDDRHGQRGPSFGGGAPGRRTPGSSSVANGFKQAADTAKDVEMLLKLAAAVV